MNVLTVNVRVKLKHIHLLSLMTQQLTQQLLLLYQSLVLIF